MAFLRCLVERPGVEYPIAFEGVCPLLLLLFKPGGVGQLFERGLGGSLANLTVHCPYLGFWPVGRGMPYGIEEKH